jgi:flagellar biosynthesis protein FliQ
MASRVTTVGSSVVAAVLGFAISRVAAISQVNPLALAVVVTAVMGEVVLLLFFGWVLSSEALTARLVRLVQAFFPPKAP